MLLRPAYSQNHVWSEGGAEKGREADGRKDAFMVELCLSHTHQSLVGGVVMQSAPPQAEGIRWLDGWMDDGWMDVSTSGYSQLNLFPSRFDLRASTPSGQLVPARPATRSLHPSLRWIDGGGRSLAARRGPGSGPGPAS